MSEPLVSCDSCWWCDEITNSKFGVVMYCHYHEETYEDYEICDEYKTARVKDVFTKMKSKE